MPNWVLNELFVFGPDYEKIIPMYLTEKDSELEFDFNKIIPMPEGIFMGPLGPKERAEHPLNWLDWSNENWGCKWPAHNTMFNDNSPEMVTFETAWAAPIPIFEALSRLHPGNTFMLSFADEDLGGGHAGEMTFRDGKIIKDDQMEIEDAYELWGLDYEECMLREREENEEI